LTDDRPAPVGLEADVLAALALGASPRPRTWVREVLADPAMRTRGTPVPAIEQVRLALHALQAGGWVVDDERRPGQWRVADFAYATTYAALLGRIDAERLRTILANADGYVASLSPTLSTGRLPTYEAALARLRLEAYSGASRERIEGVCLRLPYGMQDREALFDRVIAECLDETLFPRLHPFWRADQLVLALQRLDTSMNTGLALGPAQVVAFARALLDAPADDDSPPDVAAATLDTLRWALVEHALRADPAQACDAAWAHELLRAADAAHAVLVARPGLRLALEGAALARQGAWAEAEPAFEAALAALRKSEGRRRALLPPALAAPYVFTLLALGDAARLDKALKFCLAEGGSRQPNLDTPWGYVALAIRMRLGDEPRDLGHFRPARVGSAFAARTGAPMSTVASPLDFWRWSMRAWLKEGAQAEPLPAAEADAAARLKSRFEAADQFALAEQLSAALQVLAAEPAPPWYFVRSGLERWQSALAALAAVAQPAGAAGSSGPAAAEPESRLVWVVDVGPHGEVREIEPREQKRGVRGWLASKPVPLSRLRGGVSPAPHDAVVIAAIKAETYGRTLRIDLAAAIGALVGHPCVAFLDAPDRFVDLVAGSPTLDVVENDQTLRVRLQPPLHVSRDEAVARWGGSDERQRELEALRAITVWRDGPQRARLIRLTPAQKRVAQLLGTDGLEVPRRGASQLRDVLAGLGSHFEIHADEAVAAVAAREVPAESRLRAELQPEGPGLRLRLLAAPYGADHAAAGPRLVPGRGRARLVMTLGGETLGVQRDLALEREHLRGVLDACPMLDEPASDAPCEWQIDSPEDALSLVERLHQHHGVAALDWPQGRPVRVDAAAIGQLGVKVRTHEHWLSINGELQVDEELVVSLQQLIAFGASSRSRFMPLGEGRYVALTQELRERIDDLAAVVEAHAGKAGNLQELRVPKAAAPWLQAAALGARTEYDAGYAKQLRRLDDAQRVVPAVPSTLQASLRPYQEEGVEWALRLAHAGLGGCLADDMGLGKTLQALAVMLARAAGGPALVVAPTSLMGNWRAEALRFAPSLTVSIYAEGGAPGDRAARIAELGRGDVLLVSYPMLQIDAEAFTARAGGWHTLILDEAQAIKNAGAKRSQAVFALQADFRLALSGTPIENRLAELWSIMRACNPGLLGTQARFNERFANLIERQHDRHAQRTLRRLIAPFLLRRTKAEVLDDLPPRTELVLKVQPDEAERAHYEALRRDALVAAEKSLSGDGAGQAHLNILAGLTRLRRAACDPRLVSPKLKMVGAKVTAFAELAAELVANGHKALVFSQFVDFLALLKEPLDAAGIQYQSLDGSTPAAERTRRVDAFQAGEGDLFLISLKAGGFGLNLTVADYVVIADPWWNPAAEDQASGRAHRIGQQRPVTVYRLVAQGTLEERIVEMHSAKRELAEGVLDAEGGEGKALPGADELLALMRNDLQAPEIFG
jgi:superfamily II DNA or RNA helicase